MIKKILLVLSIFSFFIGSVYALTTYTSSSGKTSCNDTPTTGDNNNSGHKWIPINNNSSAPSSGNFNCEEHGYWGGSWSARKRKNTIYNCPDDRYASSIQWSGDKYRIYCKYRDDTFPEASDLSSTPRNNSYLTAINSKHITIIADKNGGSPIVKIVGKYEKHDIPGSYNTEKISTSDNNSSTKDRLETIENISLVDNNRNSNNYRAYNYKIVEVCDEAGNCSNNVKTFKYNIYANYIYKDGTNNYSYIDGAGDFTSGNIAQGEVQNLKLYLKDRYKNIIIPVYKADGITNIRKVGVKIRYTNDEYFLDQYSKSGVSGVQIKGITDSDYSFSSVNNNVIKNNIDSDKSHNSGEYITRFKVYTPTKIAYDKAWGNFTIDNISAYIKDNGIIDEKDFLSDLKFKYTPLYYTKLTGDLPDYGFIEGIKQNSNLEFYKTNGAMINPVAKIYLEFGSGAREKSEKLDLEYKKDDIFYKINEGHSNLITLFKENINSNNSLSFITRLFQKVGEFINSIQNQYLSTHIKYKINGYDVVYNSDIIGKDNYWDNSNIFNATQVGVKVLGKTHSRKENDIIENQDINDIHVLGNIVKSSVKKNVKEKVYKVIKNISGDNDINGEIIDLKGNTWRNLGGKKLYSDKIIYYELNGGTIILGDEVNEEIAGKKTIVIKGGDLYIKSNMYYTNPNTDILGVVILKDKDGNGGNLYIDPSVTKIVGSYYLDKALLSAFDTDNDGEISDSEILSSNTQQSVLANQLYIKGQLFSENTLGGSRKNPYVCPYFINSSDCDLETSQKYDLNYLRRYFLYDKNNSGVIGDNGDEPANGGKNYKGIYDVSVYKYARYPLVIEYNPLIQISPPPLFKNIKK